MKKSGQLKRKTRLRPVSKRRESERGDYSAAKRRYFIHLSARQRAAGLNPPDSFTPWCEVSVAEGRMLRAATDFHHVLPKGRGGKHLQSDDLMLAVSRYWHNRIHADPRWAEERGYLLKSEHEIP